LSAAAFLAVGGGVAWAMPSLGRTIVVQLADGTRLRVRQWGDEQRHGWIDQEGRSVSRNPDTGAWALESLDGTTRTAPGTQGAAASPRPAPRRPARTAAAATGSRAVPVILANFANTTTSITAPQINGLLFAEGTRSLHDYYREASYGQLLLGPGTPGVLGWYRTTRNHDYYGGNDAFGNDRKPGTLVWEAVAAADPGVNFAQYDHDGDCRVDVVSVIHQGDGEEESGLTGDIWSHSWSLESAFLSGYADAGAYTTNDPCPAGGMIVVDDYLIQPETLAGGLNTIGVFAHEYAHSLGLPDLYDTDGSSNGVGEWSLMAYGGWNSLMVPGDTPAHPDPWSKFFLGWVTPRLVKDALLGEGVSATAAAGDVYQLRCGEPLAKEYFLVENRFRIPGSFDEALPRSGLLIWHVDGDWIAAHLAQNDVNDHECYPDGPDCAVQHYGVSLVQADTFLQLERGTSYGDGGDVYPGTTNRRVFDDLSTPTSNLFDDTPSTVSVDSVSNPGLVMTADFYYYSPGDLRLTQTAIPPTADLGEEMTLRLEVYNIGPAHQLEVTLLQRLPPEATFVSASCGAVHHDGVVTWSIGGILAERTATCDVVVTLDTCGDFAATAAVDACIGEPTANNEAETSFTGTGCNADLVLSKTAPVEEASYGDPVAFTLRVSNLGPMDQSLVAVEDWLPPGLVYQGNDCGADYLGGRVAWSVGNLAAGESRSCVVSTTLQTCGEVTNAAEVSGGGVDPVPANNRDEVTLTGTGCSADLALVLETSHYIASYGEEVTFTLTVTNNGPTAAAGVTVTDTLPAGLDYLGDDCQGLLNLSTFTWSPGSLPVGGSATCHLRVKPVLCGLQTNQAGVDGLYPDPVPGNDTAQASLRIEDCVADLAVSLSAAAGTARYGEEVVFTARVENLGPMDQEDVVLGLTIPAGLEQVGNTCGLLPSGGRLQVALGTLAAGEAITCAVTLRGLSCGDHQVLAEAEGSLAEASLLNNEDAAALSVSDCHGDLRVAKEVSPSAASWGQTVTFTLSVANDGPMDQTGVVLTDHLPQGLVHLGDSCGGTVEGGEIRFDLGDMARGEERTCTISARVTGCGSLLNRAAVSGLTADPGGNNQAESALAASDCHGDLALAMTADPMDNRYGDTVRFRLTVVNHGPMGQTGVRVTQVLPAGLLFAESDCGALHGEGSVVWTAGDLPDGESRSCAVTTRVVGCTDLESRAQVAGEAPDAPGNNEARVTVTAADCHGDLAAGITADVATAGWGETATFTLEVTNLGPMDQTGVQATGLHPPGLQLLEDPCGLTPAPGGYVWNLGDLEAGGSRSCTLTARVTDCGDLEHRLTVTGGQADPPANSTASVTVQGHSCWGDLRVSQTADDADPVWFQRVTLTVTVDNLGPMDQATVAVTDTLPEGVTLVGSSCGAVLEGRLLRWTAGPLPAGGSHQCQVEVRILTCGDLVNRAAVTGTNPDPAGNSESQLTLQAHSCHGDLTMESSATIPSPLLGQEPEIVLTARNLGPMNQTGVQVSTTLPAGLGHLANTCGATVSGSSLLWSIGSLPSGGSRTCTLRTRVESCGLFTVASQISGTVADPAGNNTAGSVLDASLCQGDLSLTLDSSPASVRWGESLGATLTVTNNGPRDQGAVTVSGTLPEGIAVTEFGCGTREGTAFTWGVGSLGAGASVSCRIQATALLCGDRTFAAAVAGSQPDPAANNADQATTAVVDCYGDLSAVVTADLTSAAIGQEVLFTLSLANAGPMPQTGVELRVGIPAGLSLLGTTCGGEVTGGNITVPLGETPPGWTSSCRVTTRVESCGPQALAVSLSGAAADPAANNQATATVTGIDCYADLSVATFASKGSASYGEEVTFTLWAINGGPRDQTGVVLTDILPAGFAYVRDTCGGTHLAGTVTLTIGDLAAGSLESCQVTARLVDCGNQVNLVRVAGEVPDVPGNNEATAAVTGMGCYGDLLVSVTADRSSAPYAGTVVFTLTAGNAGPMTQTGVVLTDVLPTGLLYQSDTCGGSSAAGVVTMPLGSLAMGATRTCQVSARVNGCGSLVNAASVAGALPDLPGNGEASVMVTGTDCHGDLSVAKVADRSTASQGESVIFTVTTANAGPMTQRNVVLTDTLPAGLAYLGDDCGGSHAGGVVTMPQGSLAKGQTKTCRVTARVVSCGALVNRAAAAGEVADLPGNNEASALVTGTDCHGDLSLAMAADLPTASYGQTVVFTLTAANAGPLGQTGVEIGSTLPAGLAYLGDDCGGGHAGGLVTLPIGSLGAGGSRTCRVTARVFSCGALVNHAVVSGEAADLPGNNEASALVTGTDCHGDLSLTAAAAPTVASYGDQVVVTLTATNAGPMDQGSVVFTHHLPAGLAYLGDDCGGSHAGGVVTLPRGSIPAGGSGVCRVTARVLACGDLVSQAAVAGSQGDPPGNNEASALVTGRDCHGDLSLAVAADVGTAGYGQPVIFTLTVANAGPMAQTGVLLTDTLPPGLLYLGDDCGGSHAGGVVTIPLGNLPDGGSVACRVTARVLACGELVSQATVSGAVVDPADGNGASARVTGTGCQGDLSVVQQPDTLQAGYGTQVILAITVRNAGPMPQTGVVVEDVIPDQLSLVGDDCGGSPEGATWSWTVGDLPAGEERSCRVTARVDRCGTVVNGVTVGGMEADPAGNNRDDTTLELTGCLGDLTIALAAIPAEARYGETVAFTLRASNLGPFPQGGVVVSQDLPPGHLLVGNTCGGTLREGVFSWTVGDLAAGAGAECTLETRVVLCGTWSGEARIAGTVEDPEGNNMATASTTTSGCQGDLTLVVTAEPALVLPYRGAAAYTLRVTNLGPFAQDEVVVEDILPEGFVPGETSCAAVAEGRKLTWAVGGLAAGEVATCVVTARAETCGEARNVASVRGRVEDPEGNNTASATLTVIDCHGDLRVTAAVVGPRPSYGSLTEVVLEAVNDGPMDQEEVEAVLEFPGELVPQGNDCGAVAGGGGILTWTLGDLPAGGAAACRMTFRVASCDDLEVRARIGGGVANPGGNDTAELPMPVRACQGDLLVTLGTGSGQIPLNQAGPVTLTVVNLGPAPQRGVRLTGALDGGLLLDGSECGATLTEGALLWEVGEMAPGALASCRLDLRPTVCLDYTLAVSVSGLVADPVPGNNLTQTTLITAECDVLRFVEQFSAGDEEWYQISGTWKVNRAGQYESSPAASNLALIKSYPELGTGLVQLDLKLMAAYQRYANAAFVFAYQDPLHYRYVQVRGGYVLVGQKGSSADGGTPGIKARFPVKSPLGQRRILGVRMTRDGQAEVRLGGVSLGSYRFGGLVPGYAGLWAWKARSAFDNLKLWLPGTSSELGG
jgi:M6 family metalloprotease-like protein/uncharacterized repeat protein (TIGR01451 family)